ENKPLSCRFQADFSWNFGLDGGGGAVGVKGAGELLGDGRSPLFWPPLPRRTRIFAGKHRITSHWSPPKHAKEQIFNLTTDLYERFRWSTEYVEGVGDGLKTSIKEYDRFIGSIESRVFPQVRKLQRISGAEKELADLEPVEITPCDLVAGDWVREQAILVPSGQAQEDFEAR
ncbi:MAG: DNA recombination protein RmuC, partial [Acidobacteriaceae bacterium]